MIKTDNFKAKLLLLGSVCCLFALIFVLPGWSAECPPHVVKQAPGFYRGRLGAFEVTAISDGTVSRNLDQILSDPQTTRVELAANHEVEPMTVSVNAYLVNTKSHLVLVDTGAGDLFAPAHGMLLANIKAAGYHADQVDTILLTHIHGDHSGGLTIHGKRQFPNATVYVDFREVGYWLSDEEKQKASPTAQKRFDLARQALEPYIAAKRLVEIKPDTEIVPGITSVCAYGHTPGHTAYIVESDNHNLLFWGDTIHAAEVQFRHPEITVQYDVDPALAVRARQSVLSNAAEKGLLIGSAHISFPGLGHVRKLQEGFRWVPIPYSANVTELDSK